MRVLILVSIMLFSTIVLGQENKYVFGLATNVPEYALSTFGLDGIFMKINSLFQGELNFDYINGIHNTNKGRYTKGINESIVNHVNDRSKGWGLGGQLNISILNKEKKQDYDILIGIGYHYQSIKMMFKEDMYVSDPPYFYYRERFFNEPIVAHRRQLMCLFQVQKPLFVEVGLGIAHRNANASETLKAYRDYNKYFIDFAYSGLIPVMSFKLGYLFNR